MVCSITREPAKRGTDYRWVVRGPAGRVYGKYRDRAAAGRRVQQVERSARPKRQP